MKKYSKCNVCELWKVLCFGSNDSTSHIQKLIEKKKKNWLTDAKNGLTPGYST